MDYTVIITSIVSALGGGFLGSVISNKRDNFKILFDQQQKLNESLSNQLKDAHDMIQELTDRVNSQSVQLMMMDSAFHDDPLPRWIKSTEGVMLNLNPAYERVFLDPLGKVKPQYIGKTDIEFWGPETGLHFWKQGMKILKTRKAWMGIEMVPNQGGGKEEWLIVKYPRFQGNTIVGIAGYAIPNQDFFNNKIA